jgi:hypothetical protein
MFARRHWRRSASRLFNATPRTLRKIYRIAQFFVPCRTDRLEYSNELTSKDSSTKLLLLVGVSEMYPICPLCSTPVELAAAGTNEDGKYVHDECHTKTITTPTPVDGLLAAEPSKLTTIVERRSIVLKLATLIFGEDPMNRKSPLQRYGFAVLAALAALLIRAAPVLRKGLTAIGRLCRLLGYAGGNAKRLRMNASSLRYRHLLD